MTAPPKERSRLLLVSNRLPVTVRIEAKRVNVTPSSGGLATGLKGPHDRSGGLWIGWPGDVSKTSHEQLEVIERELSGLRAVPVHLTPGEVARYYESFSNGVLWPLFHYLSDRIPVDTHDWDTYRRVNHKFAEAIAKQHREGDIVWVHDYQLLLVPGMLREMIPTAKIGFFLHIPFPATDIFRILPWRAELLEGMLGADLIGFHTFGYMRHFAKSIVRTLGVGFDIDRVPYKGRVVHLGAYPMGVDVAEFERLAATDDVLTQVKAIRDGDGDQKILLGVDRLDYTKGITRRLVAMERLLEREPKLRGKVRLIQVAVPSREKV
ncbi:MAG: putative bifunctional trehalose-6-phosphate synthase/HAD hydrolase subfamily, partial [Myxococcaceae bacterium]|nr:putative bifunctional trehalose-6-phosphate synthase/HAD hydrolase subfamily [Myxococcaceae bacterium]